MVRFAANYGSKRPHYDELLTDRQVLEYNFNAVFIATVMTLFKLSAADDALSVNESISCDHNGEPK